MNNKKIRVLDCRTVIKEAVELLNQAVSSTLGPGGQCVLMSTAAGAHLITKDGVTVAGAIKVEDPEADLAIRAIREAAEKTNREVGDGSSTGIVLASAIYLEGLKFAETGHNINQIRHEIQKGYEKLLSQLRSYRVPTREDEANGIIESVANISLNGDEKLAKLVSDAVIKAGDFGVVTVEDSDDNTSYVEKKEGIEMNSGWVNPFFCQDRTQTTIVHEDCYFFVTSYDLNNIAQLKKLELAFSEVAKEGKTLIIMAKEVSGGMLSNLLANNKQGVLRNLAIRSPYWANLRMEFLQDIATVTGATVIEAEENFPLEKVRKEHFGRIAKIEATALKTRIIGKSTNSEQVKARIEGLKAQLENLDKMADSNKVAERLAKLMQGITVIRIARSSYLEGNERNHRIEDAINACRAAREEGVVPGGGIALLYASSVLDDSILGEKILKSAVQMPMKTIASNAGHSGDVAIRMAENQLYHSDIGYPAYDAITNSIISAKMKGLFDPFKVTRTALKNAVSIASTLLATNVIISEIPEVKPANPYNFEMFN